MGTTSEVLPLLRPRGDQSDANDSGHESCNNVRMGTTDFETILSIFKGNVGPGCLALPFAFSVLDIPLGCMLTIVMTALVGWNSWSLVSMKRQIWGIHGPRDITYSDLGEQAFGPSFRIVVDVSVITVQLAVCTVFFSNMGENLSSVLRQAIATYDVVHHDNEQGGDPLGCINTTITDNCDERYIDNEGSSVALRMMADKRSVMTILLPFVMALSFIPNLKRLAPSIAAASFFMISSFALIGLIISSNWSDGLEEWKATHPTWQSMFQYVDWNLAAMATCVIMYSLEGDQLILPIEAAMANPQRFGVVLLVSMIIIGSWFCVFGSICVVAFGNIDGGSITAFLLDHQEELRSSFPLSVSQILFLCNIIVTLSLFFTYPLQLFPAIGLTSQIVDGDSYTLRFCLVLATFLVAIIIPHLKNLIALAGAITGSMTSLIIPPLLALRFVFIYGRLKESRDQHCVPSESIFNGSLLFVGLVYGGLGTVLSIKAILDG